MRKIVLENDDPFVPLIVTWKLFVKQVKAEGVRYIVCRNEAEAEKDRGDREAIVAALNAQATRCWIGNSSYRCYLRKVEGWRRSPLIRGRCVQFVDGGASFIGIFVLRTNAKVTSSRRSCAIAIFSLSRTFSAEPKRLCAPARSSIPPTPPSAVVSSAHVPGARDAKAS